MLYVQQQAVFYIHLQSEASFSVLSLYIRGWRWARQSVTNFGSLCTNDEGRGDTLDPEVQLECSDSGYVSEG